MPDQQTVHLLKILSLSTDVGDRGLAYKHYFYLFFFNFPCFYFSLIENKPTVFTTNPYSTTLRAKVIGESIETGIFN